MAIIRTVDLGDIDDQSKCLEIMFSLLAPSMPTEKLEVFEEAVYSREDTASTYLENGLAVPHGRVAGLKDEFIVAGISKNGIDWPDSEKRANLVILIGVDRSKISAYLYTLQKILRWKKSVGNNPIDSETVLKGLENALI